MLNNGVQFWNFLTLMRAASYKTKFIRERLLMSCLGCTIWFSTLVTNSYLIFSFTYHLLAAKLDWGIQNCYKNITSFLVQYLQLTQIWHHPSSSIQSYFVKLTVQGSDDLTWKNKKRKKIKHYMNSFLCI